MAEHKGLAGIILLFIIIAGDIITGAFSSHVPATPFQLSFAEGIQVAACNLFQSGLADNETGPSTSQVIQLTAKSTNIVFWITETLADNLTSSGIKIVLYWNNTVLASNFACGTAPTGANAITQNFFYSPTVANLQFTSSLSFEWTQATPGTLYTFFVTVASSTAHAKIVVVGKVGNAVKCSLIGQAI